DNLCDLFRRAIRANLDPLHDALSMFRRGASLGPLMPWLKPADHAGSDRYPSIAIALDRSAGSSVDPSMRSASASRSSAVCSRASQIIGLTVRSAKSRYHDASSRSFDEFGMSARLVARIKL